MAEFAPSSTSAPGEQQSAPSASASSESSVVSARQQLSEQLERLMQQGLEAARGAPGSLQVEPPDTKLPLHSGAGIIVATLDPCAPLFGCCESGVLHLWYIIVLWTEDKLTNLRPIPIPTTMSPMRLRMSLILIIHYNFVICSKYPFS